MCYIQPKVIICKIKPFYLFIIVYVKYYIVENVGLFVTFCGIRKVDIPSVLHWVYRRLLKNSRICKCEYLDM